MSRHPIKGPLRIGEVFLGEYQVLEAIGRGGYGCVYRAREEFTGREVALKIISCGTGTRDNREAFERGRQEAKILCEIEHPNIVNVFRAGQTDEGHIYIVMELLRGVSLAERLRRGPLEVGEGLQILESLCDALQLVHSQNVAHRDIKPANILLREDGVAKLVDFGIAKVAGGGGAKTAPNQVPGTALYLAPEQLYSVISKGPRPAFELGDIYALGLVAFQMFQGTHPFLLLDPHANFSNPQVVWKFHVNTQVPRLDKVIEGFPSAVAMLITTAVAKDPDDRLRSMSEFHAKVRMVRTEFLGQSSFAHYQPLIQDSKLIEVRETGSPGSPDTAPVVRRSTVKQFPSDESTRYVDVEIPQATLERPAAAVVPATPRNDGSNLQPRAAQKEAIEPPTPQAGSRTVTVPGLARRRKSVPTVAWIVAAGVFAGAGIALGAYPLAANLLAQENESRPLAPGEIIIESIDPHPPSPAVDAVPTEQPTVPQPEPISAEVESEAKPEAAADSPTAPSPQLKQLPFAPTPPAPAPSQPAMKPKSQRTGFRRTIALRPLSFATTRQTRPEASRKRLEIGSEWRWLARLSVSLEKHMATNPNFPPQEDPPNEADSDSYDPNRFTITRMPTEFLRWMLHNPLPRAKKEDLWKDTLPPGVLPQHQQVRPHLSRGKAIDKVTSKFSRSLRPRTTPQAEGRGCGGHRVLLTPWRCGCTSCCLTTVERRRTTEPVAEKPPEPAPVDEPKPQIQPEKPKHEDPDPAGDPQPNLTKPSTVKHKASEQKPAPAAPRQPPPENATPKQQVNPPPSPQPKASGDELELIVGQ